MAKRIFDILMALLLILPAILIVIIAAILVKLDSPGPAIFKQIRVGRHQKTFTLFKLRTMYTDTGDHASHETSPLQITRLGVLLRKAKIDELPQIFSVLKGDMSFVGPRPCLPTQKVLIEARERYNVFSILPGITGPAQVKKIDMSMPDELARIDGNYIIERSFQKDLGYLFLTFIGHGRGDATANPNG